MSALCFRGGRAMIEIHLSWNQGGNGPQIKWL